MIIGLWYIGPIKEPILAWHILGHSEDLPIHLLFGLSQQPAASILTNHFPHLPGLCIPFLI